MPGKGDQLVRIKVAIPMKLNDRQKQLLKEFAEISREKRSKGIFEKVKERI